MIPRLSYIICTNPRSGSWLLAEGLQSTRVAGNPREWFEQMQEREASEDWNIPLPNLQTGYEKYLQNVIKAGTTGNGIFGMKCMGYQFETMAAKLAVVEGCSGLPLKEIVPKAFPNVRYIWLRRKDLVRQAISYYRAVQTNVWWKIDGLAGHPKVPANPPQPVYDPTAIELHERMLEEKDRNWQRYFKECGQEPLTLYYEDLAGHYEQNVIRALEYLGLHYTKDINIAPARLKKQANAVSEEWVERYREYKLLNGLR